MMTKPSTFASIAALAAALSMAATPAGAVELPAMASAHVSGSDAAVVTGAAAEQNQHRWRGRRHRDRGIDAGDVVAGVLVIGAIAAIAGAGRNRDRDRDRYNVRDRDYRDRDYRERDNRNDRRSDYDSNGIERAADMCAQQIERGRDRVEDINSARRTSDGWRVSGTLTSGDGWDCWIDNDGRIRSIDLGTEAYSANDGDARYPAASASGDQWSSDDYARARTRTVTPAQQPYSYRDEAQVTPAADGAQPAYPGGPLPGEDSYGDAPEWQGDGLGDDQGDGRYSTAQAPDFPQPRN